MLSVAMALLQREQYHQRASARQLWAPEYDYIIVGAGSAGSVLASRLSEPKQNRVLLLEAGGPATVLSDIPSLFIENILSTPDWGYVTTPQKYASNMFNGNSSPLLRPRVVGGSGMANAMVYNRGNERDFNGWANEFGAGSRWNYANLLQRFRMMESFQNSSYYPKELAFHGFEGRITTSVVQNPDPIHEKYQQAWNDAGYEKVDNNGKSQVGFGKCLFNLLSVCLSNCLFI